MAEVEPVEVTEPVDVVVWLRALPVGTVMLDNSGDAWQLYRVNGVHGPYLVFRCTNDSDDYQLDDAAAMATVAAWWPFRVLWTPGGAT